MGDILVTGGHGFLGTHLVSRLVERGETVRVFARPPAEPRKFRFASRSETKRAGRSAGRDGRPANGATPETNSRQVVWGDIRDAGAVDRAVQGAEIVIHLVSNFRRAKTDKEEARAINVEGTEHVLQASRRHGVRQLIHCSTIGVHGNVRAIPADETTPFNPGDQYQATKLIAEQRVLEFSRTTGLPVTVVRPISLMGPGDARMLKLFRMIKRGRFVMVGNGEPLFQPSYIDDVVSGFLACLRNPRAIGEVFIIGGDEYLPLRDLVRVIAAELGVRPPSLRVPMAPAVWLAALCEGVCAPFGIEPPLHRRRISFFQNNRAFRVEKANRVLGYRPQVSLRDGIRRTIQWYEVHGWL